MTWMLSITIVLLLASLSFTVVGWAHAAENGDQRYLTSLVAEAVSRHDYNRARWLAVTPEHLEMIARAQQEERDAKAAARGSRPASSRCIFVQNVMHCS
jgi:hypothetical protein